MVEWFKALVLKTSEVQASVGSNPTLSARGFESHPLRHDFTAPFQARFLLWERYALF